MMPATAFQGEIMLAGWSETHTGGSKVTFWLPDASALDTFRSMTVRKGNTAGQRFMAVLVELNDDDTPKPQEADKPKGGTLAQSAGMLCDTDLFQQYALAMTRISVAGLSRNQVAADYVRDFCRVTSRADLDHSPTARQLFAQLMADYRAWQQGA
jgi:hypothetical protein